jgi:hypothetical protein
MKQEPKQTDIQMSTPGRVLTKECAQIPFDRGWLVSFEGIPRNGDSWSDRAIQGGDLGELVAYSDAEIAAFVHEQGETAVLESARTATTKKRGHLG